MSQLMVTSAKFGVRNLNVLSFSAPIFATIGSAQTKTRAQHFPIKAIQPELQLSLIFASEADFEDFQGYIRNVQLDALHSASPGLTLNWPERMINNLSGLPKSFIQGGMRFNPYPKAALTIELINSLASSGVGVPSIGIPWLSITGVGSPDGILTPPGMPASFIPNATKVIQQKIVPGGG